jgi:predicted outer membrane repeat protein
MRIYRLSYPIILALGLLFGLGWLVSQPPEPAAAGTIQSMIDDAPSGGTVTVPAGVYTESLTVNKTLTITGVSSATTIIHAVGGQRVMTVTTGNALRLVNLSLTGGQPSGGGGGVYVQNARLTLVNCILANNSASYGGGIYQDGPGGRVDATGSVIELNTAAFQGGGLYILTSAALTNTQVLSNTASADGGGMFVQNGRTDVVGGVFSNNQALGGNGGAVNVGSSVSISGTQIVSNTARLNGGGLEQWNLSPTAVMTGTRFERNTAQVVGGGAAISGTLVITGSTFVTNTVDSGSSSSTFGGGVYAGGATQIFGSTFTGNSALCDGGSCANADGGGLYVSQASLMLVRVTFRSNQAGSLGGGMGSVNNSPVLFDVIFSGNDAGWGGGAYFQQGNPALTNVLFSGNYGSWGGGMLAWHNTATLAHVTFSGNQGYNFGGALENGYGTITLTNSILWGNSARYGPQIYDDAGSGTTATYSDIQFTGVYTGAGNINADPLFAVPISATLAPTTAGDYHLMAASPAIDHGTNAGVTTDLDGLPRPLLNGYDMGAYEAQAHVYLPLVRR